MSDVRARRTGEGSPPLIKVMADAAAMREQIDALEGRVLRLEGELAALRAIVAKLPAPAPAPRTASRRPAGGPPPLPPMPEIRDGRASAAPRKASRRSIVDVSETAELIESIPPPPRPPRR
jgi:hypothetical protein